MPGQLDQREQGAARDIEIDIAASGDTLAAMGSH